MALINRCAAKIIKSACLRSSSTAAPAVQIQEELTQPFRTKENNPVNHTKEHLSRFYTIPPEDAKNAFVHGIQKINNVQFTTFNEMSIMVREPAIELLAYLRQTDFTKPVNKYVIYGQQGCGKTTTLYHIIHYGYKKNKIIVNIPWAHIWFTFPKEVATSETNESMMDLPIDAAAWLVGFKGLNADLLARADVRLSKTYQWGAQETLPKDAPIIELVNLGISRMKFACDIIIALMKELKIASTSGKIKTLVAIDGYNSFFGESTRIKNNLKKFVPASQISLTQAFLEITKSDWCNGEIVVTVDILGTKERRDSHYPRYLLGKEGFEHLDPFVPISVDNFSQDEFDAMVDYYKNRKWIRKITPEGEKELHLLSGGNPEKLRELCKHL